MPEGIVQVSQIAHRFHARQLHQPLDQWQVSGGQQIDLQRKLQLFDMRLQVSMLSQFLPERWRITSMAEVEFDEGVFEGSGIKHGGGAQHGVQSLLEILHARTMMLGRGV